MSEKKSFSDVLVKSIFVSNPVLIHCVGLCPVVAASANLRDSFFLSVALMINIVVTCFIASAVLKKIPRFVRMAVYLVLGVGIMFPCLWLIERKTLINLSLGMKIYLPLIAVNSLTAVQCETYSVKHGVKDAFLNSVATGAGMSAVLLLCGAVREITGSGTIAGYPLGLSFTLNSMAMPFGCMIMLGFLAAGLKAVSSYISRNKEDASNIQPEEITMEFGETDIAPSAIELGIPEDDEYEDLLSSVNELIESFSDEKGGDGE